ncbi:hypothetical protein HY407_01675 [Candidatus Gottesmanbacteria bacterium]|nr:hypothetical protein [Candidatus Gottesmanbacteria bacterium]
MDKKIKNPELTTPDKLIRTLDELDNKNQNMKKYYIIGLVIIVAGVITGLVLGKSRSVSSATGLPISGGKKIVGSTDTSLFKDVAEGKLEKGGIDGEGTHKLIRPGGDSQTVYLKSSVLDLQQFVGKKIKIWGKTYAAQKAAWLMDVGRVELLE